MSRISAQLQGLLLEEGTWSLDKAYIMSQDEFKAYNDAAHVFIEKRDMNGEIVMKVSLYDLVIQYVMQFGGRELNHALNDVLAEEKQINADLIFIVMVLFTDSTFGLFFTGKFNYDGATFSIQEIIDMLSMWVERAWSFWHFENIMDQRLFFAAMLVRMELAANRREMWNEADGNLRDFFSNPREPKDPFEQYFMDWCSAATRHVEIALEFSAFANPTSRARAHVPMASPILAFAMSRRVPQYLREGNAWILSYFRGVDFHYAGRLNVVYKPERNYKTIEEIQRDVNNAVDDYRTYAEELVDRLSHRQDLQGNQLSKRQWQRDLKLQRTLRQKRKDLKVLDGRCGLDDEGNEIPDEDYNGYIGEDARELREAELRATVQRNSYIYTRILDSFPLMNRVSNIEEAARGEYKVTVQLYSYRQYAKEVDKIRTQHRVELMIAVDAEMNMRRRLRAVYLAQKSRKVYKDLTEEQKQEFLDRAEKDMKTTGEWDRTKVAASKRYLDEQIAKLKAEDARVNYTINVEGELLENTRDFSNTALQMAAIIPAVDGLYINERVRLGVLRIFHGKQKTYAQYQADEAIKEERNKYEQAIDDILKEADEE